VKDAGFGGTGNLACAVFAIVTAATNCLLEVAGDFKGAPARVPVLLKRARIKCRSESARRKGGIEDQKARTLERHQGAPPENSKSIKGLATRPLRPYRDWTYGNP
jgi:hypothetical protein